MINPFRFFATGSDKPLLDDKNVVDRLYKKYRRNVMLTITTGYEIMKDFYFAAQNLGDEKKSYFQTYWDNWDLSKSTFIKFSIYGNLLDVDIYRNDGFGGSYLIDKSLKLSMETKTLINN